MMWARRFWVKALRPRRNACWEAPRPIVRPGARGCFCRCWRLGVLWAIDIDTLTPDISDSDRQITQIVLWGAGIGILLHWVSILLLVKVVVDDHTITSHGMSFGPQTRPLSDLTGIAMEPKRKKLQLTFRNAKPILVPNHLSQRAEFIERMEAQITKNSMRLR